MWRTMARRLLQLSTDRGHVVFPDSPDGLVRVDKGGLILGRTLLTQQGVSPLPIVKDLDVVKEIHPCVRP